MRVLTYSTAREHLIEVMERVCDNHEPVILTKKNAASVILMSLEDYNAISGSQPSQE